jgi:hypothetical protein
MGAEVSAGARRSREATGSMEDSLLGWVVEPRQGHLAAIAAAGVFAGLVVTQQGESVVGRTTLVALAVGTPPLVEMLRMGALVEPAKKAAGAGARRLLEVVEVPKACLLGYSVSRGWAKLVDYAAFQILVAGVLQWKETTELREQWLVAPAVKTALKMGLEEGLIRVGVQAARVKIQ